MDPLATLNDAIATLNATSDAAEAAVSREQFSAEQAQIDESFKGPHGVLLGTKEQRDEVHKTHRAAWEQAAGRSRYALEHDVVPQQAQAIEAAIAELSELPDAETVLDDLVGSRGKSLEAGLLVEVVDELRTARLQREYREEKPSIVLQRYRRAGEAHTMRSVAERRVIEGLHRKGWTGRPHQNEQDAHDAATLAKEIGVVRETRLPPQAKAAREAVERARRLVGKLETLHRIRPVRPSEVA